MEKKLVTLETPSTPSPCELVDSTTQMGTPLAPCELVHEPTREDWVRIPRRRERVAVLVGEWRASAMGEERMVYRGLERLEVDFGC